MAIFGGARGFLRGLAGRSGGGTPRPPRPNQAGRSGGRPRGTIAARAASSGAGNTAASTGMNPWLKAGLTSGSMCAGGDLLAQTISRHLHKDTPALVKPYEFGRTLRMASWGLCFYGPYQNWWYALLARTFQAKTTANFAIKVALNQVALGPVVSLTVFSWTLGLQNKFNEIPGKIERDLVSTIQNGWKFWVPAACVNFYCIPLQYQVLYMSTCGLFWTGYLSFASNLAHQEVEAIPADPKGNKSK